MASTLGILQGQLQMTVGDVVANDFTPLNLTKAINWALNEASVKTHCTRTVRNYTVPMNGSSFQVPNLIKAHWVSFL